MRTIAIVLSFVVLPLLHAQGWVDRSTANGPSPRYNHAFCYDAAHGYTLLFGGIGYSASPPGYVVLNDTWSWNGTGWTQHQTVTSVPNLSSNVARSVAMTYHAATARV